MLAPFVQNTIASGEPIVFGKDVRYQACLDLGGGLHGIPWKALLQGVRFLCGATQGDVPAIG